MSILYIQSKKFRILKLGSSWGFIRWVSIQLNAEYEEKYSWKVSKYNQQHIRSLV